MIPYDDSDFESLYQNFIASRPGQSLGSAFDQPALREDIDRELMEERFGDAPAKDTGPVTCEHGLTPLTCATCYFNGPGYSTT